MEWTDKRWLSMQGGYRIAFDPRPQLLALSADPANSKLWDKLIQELYHQGDVGEASYAAVIELDRLVPVESTLPWQLLALVVWIDLARGVGSNPKLPGDFESDYLAAIESLALRSLRELAGAATPEQSRIMLALVALWKGQRIYAKTLAENAEDELAPLLPG